MHLQLILYIYSEVLFFPKISVFQEEDLIGNLR